MIISSSGVINCSRSSSSSSSSSRSSSSISTDSVYRLRLPYHDPRGHHCLDGPSTLRSSTSAKQDVDQRLCKRVQNRWGESYSTGDACARILISLSLSLSLSISLYIYIERERDMYICIYTCICARKHAMCHAQEGPVAHERERERAMIL